MNSRIQKLREQSINAVPSLTPERALLITDFYENRVDHKDGLPVQRGKALLHIFENKEICINEGDLIVGERGPAPKATPTYPELTVHSVQDLEILDTREKTSYKVDREMREIYRKKIIPFWKGKTVRERIFSEVSTKWKQVYEAGLFTEFMEQRAPGHTVLDGKIYSQGMNDFKKKIKKALDKLDFLNDPEALNKRDQLKGMSIAADAVITLAKRHANRARELASTEKDKTRKTELLHIADVCEKVPANKPETFQEAMQYYWFVHLGVITELNPWDAFNPGKLDQHLYPFYKREVEDSTLTLDKAKELLQAFWIKFNNQPAPPKVGVTAAESGTYTDFAQINNGGIKSDGTDGVSELSYIILEVVDEMRLTQPSPSVQISKKTPERFLKETLKVVRNGSGQPSIFNMDAVVQELVRQGKSLQDAREGGTSGCVETGAFGKENYCLTGYFNMVKVLEITLYNGLDPLNGNQIGLKTGKLDSFSSFDDFFAAFKKQMKYFVDIKVEGNNIIERIFADTMPVPFLSLLIDDCISTGRDYHSGGARYNTSYIQGVGLGTITDVLSAIKYSVFEGKGCSSDQLIRALDTNFQEDEKLRQFLLNRPPKFGNDNDYVDDIMKQVFEAYYEVVNGRKNMKGGTYRVNLLPTTVHVYFGSKIGATADGRYAFEPLSEGVSPVQGSDRFGPTAVVKSVGKIDHLRTGGTLLNMKFTPQLLETDENISALASLIRTYFKLDGHHIQFNVVNVKTLRKAQETPEKYRHLIVRVAGYSDYFVDLGKDLQDEIINRTEHTNF